MAKIAGEALAESHRAQPYLPTHNSQATGRTPYGRLFSEAPVIIYSIRLHWKALAEVDWQPALLLEFSHREIQVVLRHCPVC